MNLSRLQGVGLATTYTASMMHHVTILFAPFSGDPGTHQLHWPFTQHGQSGEAASKGPTVSGRCHSHGGWPRARQDIYLENGATGLDSIYSHEIGSAQRIHSNRQAKSDRRRTGRSQVHAMGHGASSYFMEDSPAYQPSPSRYRRIPGTPLGNQHAIPSS